jgi:hypothetical protein
MNYRKRLNEMLKAITEKYGKNHNRTAMFALYVNKLIGQANWQNREFFERLFKGWMK